MPKKSFVPPFGSKLVLNTTHAKVEIEFAGEDTAIEVRPLFGAAVVNMAPCEAEELAKTLVQAAKLACGG